MPIVFVNYRHEDSGGYAGRIAEGLQARFGADNVFRDIDAIRGGLSFEEELDRRLARATVVVVVMGKQWATITDDKGNRRLQTSDDWVRREVEETLRRKIPIVPVLVGGAALPKRDELPESIYGLLNMQAVELRDGRCWVADMGLLAKDIDDPVARGVPPPLRRVRRWLSANRSWAALPLFGLAVGLVGLYLLRSNSHTPQEFKPGFDVRVEPAETCFTFDRATGATSAEFSFRIVAAGRRRIQMKLYACSSESQWSSICPSYRPASTRKSSSAPVQSALVCISGTIPRSRLCLGGGPKAP